MYLGRDYTFLKGKALWPVNNVMTFYLILDEEQPLRMAKNKYFIPKIIFLVCIAILPLMVHIQKPNIRWKN